MSVVIATDLVDFVFAELVEKVPCFCQVLHHYVILCHIFARDLINHQLRV